MRNSNILFLVAVLILGWFGAEVYLGGNICVTTCWDLSGYPGWEQALAVIILPAILIAGGVRARQNESRVAKTPVPQGGQNSPQ